jgi:hypothetical protein
METTSSRRIPYIWTSSPSATNEVEQPIIQKDEADPKCRVRFFIENRVHTLPNFYLGDGLLPADAGGQGDAPVPGVAFWLFPGADGAEPEFAPEFGEFGLVAPASGFALPVAPAVPGKDPQGEPLGLFPGVVFGSIVDGFVVLPGVGGFGEFAPGTVDGALGVGDGVVGVEVPPGGVAVFGACVWLAAPEVPAGGAPPAGAACATTEAAQSKMTERKPRFLVGIRKPPALNFDRSLSPRRHRRCARLF